MDVIPTVAQEAASRYHKKAGERAMSSAVTADLTALLTRLWLLQNSDGLDEAGDVAATVAAIEQQVEDMVDYLLHRVTPPGLSTLSLQVRCDHARASHTTQAHQAAVKKEAIALQLEDALLSMEAGLVTVEQVWAALAISLMHHYSSGSALVPTSATAAATNTTTNGTNANGTNPTAAGGGSAGAVGANAGVHSSNDPAYGEAISAVSAALPRAQVAAFLRQDRVARAGQLRQLRRIAWGLRLYQRETGRSAGMDMMHLPTTVDAPLAGLEKKCATALAALEGRVRLTRALLTSPTCSLSPTALSVLREEYHHLLLMLHVLKCAQCGLHQLRDCVSGKVITAYQTTLTELRELLTPSRKTPAAAGGTSNASTTTTNTNVNNNNNNSTAGATAAVGANGANGGASSEAAPKKVVFPKFMELADAYELGMKCADEFSHFSSLLQIVAESAEGYSSTLPANAANDALAREQAHADSAAAVQATTSNVHHTGNATSGKGPHPTSAALAAEIGAILDSDSTRQRLPPDVHVHYCADLPLHTVDAVVARLYPQSLCAMRGFCPVHYLEGRPLSRVLLPGQVAARTASSSPPSPTSGEETHVSEAAETTTKEAASPAGSTPGDASLGCIEVSGGTGPNALPRPLRFVFTDAAAMRVFAANPWHYVHNCLRVFHAEEPTVSLVMGLADELPRELYLEGARTVEKVSSMASNTQKALDKVDCGTQTGQIDSYIDHHYFWNEWDLRRHALKLANLMQMRTHSSQTTASHFRREATTQINPMKDSETQTLQDAATQPPRVVQYLKGLRGTETSTVEQFQHVVEY